MTDVPRPADLAVLIDEHLLDSFLAVAALRPRRAHLLHAPPMTRQMRRLESALMRRLGVPSTPVGLTDDTDVHAVRSALAALPHGTHLDHTGGTGALAALAARHLDGPGSCFDEDRRLLRFDDGVDVELDTLIDPEDVTLDDALMLAGFTRRRDGREISPEGPAEEEALALLVEPDREHELSHHRRRPGAHGKHWRRFLDGEWLELAVAAAVRAQAPGHTVESHVRLHRDSSGSLELDVLAMGRYRPYVISCTTSTSAHALRQKLFEVEVRAGQIGGAAARPALACLAPPSPDGRYEALVAPVADPWPTLSAARIFRPSDLLRPNGALAHWLRT